LRRYIPLEKQLEKGTAMTDRANPQVGELAPPISASTATGEMFELSDHRGEYVVAYFYPRANTPG
jgi:peroxiredoxin